MIASPLPRRDRTPRPLLRFRSSAPLLLLLSLLTPGAGAQAPSPGGGYETLGAGSARLQNNVLVLDGSENPGNAPLFALRNLPEPGAVVAVRGTLRQSGGSHRMVYLALGSSGAPDAVVTGGIWSGIGRLMLGQYSKPDAEHEEKWLPEPRHPLPDAKQGFSATLMVDTVEKRVVFVAEGCEPIQRPLLLALPNIDRVGFAVRGKTIGEFRDAQVSASADQARQWIAEATARAGKGPAPRGEIAAMSIANAQTVGEAGWADNAYRRPSNSLALRDTPEGRILEATVQSRGALFFQPNLAFRKGKVIRIEVTARSVGQIEQIAARMNHRQFAEINWPIHRDWHTYTAQAAADGGTYAFNLRLDGVGTFQVKNITVTEVDDFELPPAESARRGELLTNGDFALGTAGWSFRYPEEETFPGSPGRTPASEVIAIGGAAGLRLPAGRRSLLDSTEDLRFFRGRTYTIRIEGDAAGDDADLFLIRPGMSTVDSEHFPLRFENGVATVTFSKKPPENGWFSFLDQSMALRIRHRGAAPAEFRSVSVVEDSAPGLNVPRVALVTTVEGDPRPVALRGRPVTVGLRCAGLAEAEKLTLVVVDERGGVVRRLPVTVGPPEDGAQGAAVVLSDLGPGWYRFTAERPEGELRVLAADFAVIPPLDPNLPRNRFLGTHLGRVTHPWHLDLHRQLGVGAVRVWELAWDSVQPGEDGPVRIPVGLLDAYRAGGLEPFVVLAGTPDWASTATEAQRKGWREAQKYPPADWGDWEHYVREVVRQAGDRVTYYEIWNEPNGHFLKAPQGRKLEDIYAELVRRAYPIIKAENPNAVVVVGACAGHPSFAIQTIRKHGLNDHYDAISYHAYGASEEAGRGASAFAFTQDYLRGQLRELERADVPVIDSESGIKSFREGPEGHAAAMTLAQGLVARQAAGFSQYHLYNSVPAEYPGQTNFNMLFGAGDRPLVSLPMIAAWDRLLRNAVFQGNLGDDAKGLHLYRFLRPDGAEVIAAWRSLPGAPERFPLEGANGLRAVDAMGRPLPDAVENGALRLDGELRYFLPIGLLPEPSPPRP